MENLNIFQTLSRLGKSLVIFIGILTSACGLRAIQTPTVFTLSQTPTITFKSTSISPDTPTATVTAAPSSTPFPTKTPTPVATPNLRWSEEDFQWLEKNFVNQIFFHMKFLQDMPRNDPLIQNYFATLSVIQDEENGNVQMVFCAENDCPGLSEIVRSIPPWEWCQFIERAYPDYGWALITENRVRALGEKLQSELGNPNIGAYCPNFDALMTSAEATEMAPWLVPTPSLNWDEREYGMFAGVLGSIFRDDDFKEQFPCTKMLRDGSRFKRGWDPDIDPFLYTYFPYYQACPMNPSAECFSLGSDGTKYPRDCPRERWISEEVDPIQHPEMIPEWDWCTFLERTYPYYGFEGDYVPTDQNAREEYLIGYFRWEGIGDPYACSPRAVMGPCNMYCPNFDPHHSDMVRLNVPLAGFPIPPDNPLPAIVEDPLRWYPFRDDILFEIFKDVELFEDEALLDRIESDQLVKEIFPGTLRVSYRDSDEKQVYFCTQLSCLNAEGNPRRDLEVNFNNALAETPLKTLCLFVERMYPFLGWENYTDRDLVLDLLQKKLGDPQQQSGYPYCENFDPSISDK